MTKLHPWQIVGVDASGKPISKVVHSLNGREAEIEAKRLGIKAQSITPIHEPSIPEVIAPSVVSPADWARLERAITRGVFRATILIWGLSVAIWIIVYFILGLLVSPK